jgi:hypothetical protein
LGSLGELILHPRPATARGRAKLGNVWWRLLESSDSFRRWETLRVQRIDGAEAHGKAVWTSPFEGTGVRLPNTVGPRGVVLRFDSSSSPGGVRTGAS